MVKRFLLRWLVNFLGLWTASTLLAGIHYDERIGVLVVAAGVFSLVNAFIRPLVVLLSLPAIVLSLGLFTFVINTLMLYIVAALYPRFQIESFWTGLLAVVIIWVVNYLLNDLLEPKREKHV